MRHSIYKAYKLIKITLCTDHRVTKMMLNHTHTLKYSMLPIFETFCLIVSLDRKASLITTVVFMYMVAMISTRVSQIVFCFDIVKVRLQVLKVDVESYQQQQSQPNPEITSQNIMKIKKTYEEIYHLSTLINECGKVTFLVLTAGIVVLSINTVYYGVLYVTKDIQVMTGTRKSLSLHLNLTTHVWDAP